MNQLKLDETLTIVSNEETKNSVNAVVSKMPSKVKDRLKRENNSSKKVVVTIFNCSLVMLRIGLLCVLLVLRVLC